MAFAFEKLIVYQKAVDFADKICATTSKFPINYYISDGSIGVYKTKRVIVDVAGESNYNLLFYSVRLYSIVV